MFKTLITLLSCSLFSFLLSAQPVDNLAVLSRKQVPILCYHQIRNWRRTDKQVDKDYIIPPETFKAHLKMLSDSGYHTILPDELYDYLTKGKPLPLKPILLTFDDTDGDPYKIARPELTKYGFKGVYFITTINILKNKHYMDKKQLKQLSADGNVIACHTRDHTNFKKYKEGDWETQLNGPKKKLEAITGKPVNYFAFPFGEWNAEGLPQLHIRGFKAAFQLMEPRDRNDPIMTIRRILDCGYWTDKTLYYHITHDFGRAKEMKTVSLAKTKTPKL